MSGQRIEINEVSAQVLSGSVLVDTTYTGIAHALDSARAGALDPDNSGVCPCGCQRIARVSLPSSKPGLNLQVEQPECPLFPQLHKIP